MLLQFPGFRCASSGLRTQDERVLIDAGSGKAMFIPTAVISTEGRNLQKFGRSLPSVEMTVFLKPLLCINKKTSVHAVHN